MPKSGLVPLRSTLSAGPQVTAGISFAWPPNGVFEHITIDHKIKKLPNNEATTGVVTTAMVIVCGSKMTDSCFEVTEEDQEIVELCSEAAETTRSIVSSITKTVTADIRAPAFASDDVSQKKGVNWYAKSRVQSGLSVRNSKTKVEALRENVKVFVVKDDDDAE